MIVMLCARYTPLFVPVPVARVAMTGVLTRAVDDDAGVAYGLVRRLVTCGRGDRAQRSLDDDGLDGARGIEHGVHDHPRFDLRRCRALSSHPVAAMTPP